MITTPGGRRRASSVRTVKPTDTVRVDQTGFQVTPNTAQAAAVAPDIVVTPGGPRQRSLINHVESGSTLRVDAGDWKIMDARGAVVKRIVPPVLEKSETFDLAAGKPPGLGTGWICATFWNNNTGSPIASVQTTWTVPPFPTTQSGQLIYLFNGVQVQVPGTNPTQSGLHILQPVLQWGVSPDGGGNDWAVASWFVGSQTQPVAKTPLTNVNPGQVLTGVITLTGVVAGLLNYRCQFNGFPNSVLNVQMPAPFQAVETLECYGIQQCPDYPRTNRTQMRAISISTQAGVAPLAWTPQDYVTDCAQSIQIISNSATNGEVDILYPNIGIGGYDLASAADSAFAFDYDSNGKTDYLSLDRPGTGTIWILRNSAGTFTPAYAQGSPGSGIGGYDLKSPDDKVFAFDYDGSGKQDHVALYRPGTGTMWILKNSGGNFSPVYAQGSPGNGIGGYDLKSTDDRAFGFDYDGSGKADHMTLYRPGTGTIWILKRTGSNFAPVYHQGSPGNGIGGYDLKSTADSVFAFDYDSSGKLDHLVLYRPGTGTIWILKNTGGNFTAVYAQGSPGNGIGGYDLKSAADRVFAFDYDGSGKLDHLALYRPGTGTIWISNAPGRISRQCTNKARRATGLAVTI